MWDVRMLELINLFEPLEPLEPFEALRSKNMNGNQTVKEIRPIVATASTQGFVAGYAIS